MMEHPVKTSSGFHGRRTNLITMVHLVVISYGPVYKVNKHIKAVIMQHINDYAQKTFNLRYTYI